MHVLEDQCAANLRYPDRVCAAIRTGLEEHRAAGKVEEILREEQRQEEEAGRAGLIDGRDFLMLDQVDLGELKGQSMYRTLLEGDGEITNDDD